MAIDRYVYTPTSRVERKGFHSIGLPLLFILFFLSFACPALAQERRGKLPNGMSYILRHNAQPRKKMEARLVMRVGSCAQRPDEAGYAHFIEHLAFGRTKHFASGGIKRYAERLGTRYGVGLNAMTGHDRTVYMISLPTDEPHVLDSTALILSESLTIGTLGGLLGAYASVMVILAVTIVRHWQPVLDPVLVPLGVVGGIVVGTLGGALATSRAGRIQPSDALRTT